MKVFISWSGTRSKQVATLFNDWIPMVLQSVECWISTTDIERGSMWSKEIFAHLNEASIGIVCLTEENKNNPWILFETGALSKGLPENRVCPFLIDLTVSNVGSPLSLFNLVIRDKESVRQLMRTINNALLDKSLEENRFNRTFEKYWPEFDSSLDEIIEQTKSEDIQSEIEPAKPASEQLLHDLASNILRLANRISGMDMNINQLFNEVRNHPGSRLSTEALAYRMPKELGTPGIGAKDYLDKMVELNRSPEEMVTDLMRLYGTGESFAAINVSQYLKNFHNIDWEPVNQD
ncbi:toll/interleukin-1 receptor domain-containing protein [Arsenicibacter rosenii]|uniref:TIR domain-containing protein n=1 Tax=Arsenicibacter rosenii TaxID=1750698 RepID=A0A1S2VM64_9BACT|nr:toll/interleukin-1 receptor domain-containing protein [Arsenicibacter rosenii]OIN59844.1 hypothetical protein BLX24_08270 [Arsenicibacter rosenii]